MPYVDLYQNRPYVFFRDLTLKILWDSYLRSPPSILCDCRAITAVLYLSLPLSLHHCYTLSDQGIDCVGKLRWLMVLQWRKWCDWWICWMDFCFSCCLVQKLRERPYVGNVPGEAVAVYCCTVFVSVSLSVYCCLWACCVLYDIFFCVCPIDCHCVCVLTLLIWYPYKKIVCPLIFLSVIVWYKFCNVWHSGWFTCYLQEGTSVDWILLVVLWCCFRKYWFLNLSLIAGIWIDFLYPLLDVHYGFSRCGLMFLSIADSGIAKWAAAAWLGLTYWIVTCKGFRLSSSSTSVLLQVSM